MDTYMLNQEDNPVGLFRDGAPYLYVLCLLHHCRKRLDLIQQKVASISQAKKGSHPEEPDIKFEDGVFFRND